MNTLSEFESDDILYHYTKTTTALEHILFKKELRLSDRVNSNDPIENMTTPTLIKVESLENETYDNWDKYGKEIEKKMKQIKQVCFCMNAKSIRYKKMNNKPAEFYGCMKPRMWEQYGNNYNGVCLILSKAELLKQLDKGYKYKKVKYVNYDDLKNKKIEIDSNDLRDSYYTSCLEKVNRQIDKYIFHKHKDYVGENEYRIRAYSDEDLYINIKSALKGILVSNKNSEYFVNKLLEYAEECKFNVFKISWASNGADPINLIERIELKKENDRIANELKKRMSMEQK
ncbi:DUF2971 domain-containing protein [Ancylomarina salipaludis]|nr:DUF2971 domain-containing protein [Ancylomarina salipaludis]